MLYCKTIVDSCFSKSKVPKIYLPKFVILFQPLSHFPLKFSLSFHHLFYSLVVIASSLALFIQCPRNFPSPFHTHTRTLLPFQLSVELLHRFCSHTPLLISTTFCSLRSAPLYFRIQTHSPLLPHCFIPIYSHPFPLFYPFIISLILLTSPTFSSPFSLALTPKLLFIYN